MGMRPGRVLTCKVAELEGVYNSPHVTRTEHSVLLICVNNQKEKKGRDSHWVLRKDISGMYCSHCVVHGARS